MGSTLQNLSTNAWTGSVLVVSYGNQPPQLSLSHTGHQFLPQPVCLDSFQNYCFWRWQLDLKLLHDESLVEYWVTTEWAQGQVFQKPFRFTLPGANQCWHWGFHSCNGFSHGRAILPLSICVHVLGRFEQNVIRCRGMLISHVSEHEGQTKLGIKQSIRVQTYLKQMWKIYRHRRFLGTCGYEPLERCSETSQQNAPALYGWRRRPALPG